MLSIIAGFLIGMGGIINLTIGGIAGAIFFALGLMTIVSFKYDLFTGKAGLLATNEISLLELSKIWFGNLIGAMSCAGLALLVPSNSGIIEKAHQIVLLRYEQSPVVNLVLGIFCGLLMYIAVMGFKSQQNYLFIFVPVAFFILCGFNHCVADMFYLSLGTVEIEHWGSLIPTTIGNVIGTNLLPILGHHKNL